MAFNNYITLDSLKYKTTHKSWRPAPNVPSTGRVLLSGALDVTFGAVALNTWNGEIVAPVVADAAGWGTIADLRAALAKKQIFTFIDHYGTSFSVYAQGPFTERSAAPDWSVNENVVYVTVKLMGKPV